MCLVLCVSLDPSVIADRLSFSPKAALTHCKPQQSIKVLSLSEVFDTNNSIIYKLSFIIIFRGPKNMFNLRLGRPCTVSFMTANNILLCLFSFCLFLARFCKRNSTKNSNYKCCYFLQVICFVTIVEDLGFNAEHEHTRFFFLLYIQTHEEKQNNLKTSLHTEIICRSLK